MSTEGAELWREGRRASHEAKTHEDEQRRASEADLAQKQQSGAISPAQWAQGMHDLYAHEPTESRWGRIGRGLERIVGAKKKANEQKQQADQKLAAQPSPRKDLASIQAGAKSPQQLASEAEKQRLETYRTESGIDAENRRPTTDEAKREDYRVAVQSGYRGSYEQWVAEQSAKGHAAGAAASKPIFKTVKGHLVVIDPQTKSVTKDLGPVAGVKRTTHQAIQTDADGTPHIVSLTSVTTPEGATIEGIETPGDESEEKPKGKGPAPKAGGAPKPPKDDTLNFRKATPQSNAAKKRVDDMEFVSTMGDRANNKSLTPLERAAAQRQFIGSLQKNLEGRFNQGAYDNLSKKYGYGQRFETWLNDFSAGELPDEVIDAIVKGAHADLEAAKEAATKYSQPAPKGGKPAPQGGDNPKVIEVTPEDMK